MFYWCFFSLSAKPEAIDLVIALGASGQNASEIFTKQKDFISEIVEQFKLSQDAMLPGLITYGKDAQVPLKLGTVVDKQSFNYYLADVDNPSDGTNLKRVLDEANKMLMEKGRTNIPKVVLLLVDKKSTSSLPELLTAKKGLENMGVKIVVVGFGNEVDRKELVILASSKDGVFLPKGVKGMEDEVAQVASALKPGKLEF